MNKKQISITLGIMCFILTMSIIVQIKTMNNASATVGQTLTENGLRDEVLKWKEKYDSVYSQLGQAENRLEKVRNIATQDSSTSSAKQEELKNNNILLGLTDVTGPGMEIILKDNTNISSELLSTQILDMSKLVVHNTDLTAIVNMLRHANAEAISINGQRIIATSAITCEGSVIKINGEKITSPFTIKAIGPTDLFYGSLMTAARKPSAGQADRRTGGVCERTLFLFGIPAELRHVAARIPPETAMLLNSAAT